MIVAMSACAGDPADDDQPAGRAPTTARPGAIGGRNRPTPPTDGAVDETTLATGVAATRAVGRRVSSCRSPSSARRARDAAAPGLVHRRGAAGRGGVRHDAGGGRPRGRRAGSSTGDWSHPTGVVIDGDAVYSQLGPMAEALGREPDDWVRARLAEVTVAGAENDALALALDPLGPLDLLYRPSGRWRGRRRGATSRGRPGRVDARRHVPPPAGDARPHRRPGRAGGIVRGAAGGRGRRRSAGRRLARRCRRRAPPASVSLDEAGRR